jgi:hypothetical protein
MRAYPPPRLKAKAAGEVLERSVMGLGHDLVKLCVSQCDRRHWSRL